MAAHRPDEGDDDAPTRLLVDPDGGGTVRLEAHEFVGGPVGLPGGGGFDDRHRPQ